MAFTSRNERTIPVFFGLYITPEYKSQQPNQTWQRSFNKKISTRNDFKGKLIKVFDEWMHVIRKCNFQYWSVVFLSFFQIQPYSSSNSEIGLENTNLFRILAKAKYVDTFKIRNLHHCQTRKDKLFFSQNQSDLECYQSLIKISLTASTQEANNAQSIKVGGATFVFYQPDGELCIGCSSKIELGSCWIMR